MRVVHPVEARKGECLYTTDDKSYAVEVGVAMEIYQERYEDKRELVLCYVLGNGRDKRSSWQIYRLP